MKVTRNLQISAKEFFNAVFDELYEEITKISTQKISRDSLKTGFHYIYKSEDAYQRIDFKIVEYKEDTFYKSVRTSLQGTVSITYEVAPTEDGITVTFSQETDERESLSKKPKLFTMFSDAYILGRMTDKLYGFQKNIINEKEGYTEKDFGSPLMPTIRRKK